MEPNTNNGGNILKEFGITIGLAILGGISGGGLWFGLSFLGRMAVAAGLVAGALGLLGAMISGEENRVLKCIIAGVISFALYGVGIYLGIGVDILVISEFSISLGDAISLIPPILQEGSYIGSLILQLVLGIASFGLGAIGCYAKNK